LAALSLVASTSMATDDVFESVETSKLWE